MATPVGRSGTSRILSDAARVSRPKRGFAIVFQRHWASRWTEVLAESTTHFAEHVCVTRPTIGWCRWLGKAVFAATRRGFIAGRRGEAARPVIATKATCTTQWCRWFSGSVPGMPRSRRSPAIHPGGSAATRRGFSAIAKRRTGGNRRATQGSPATTAFWLPQCPVPDPQSLPYQSQSKQNSEIPLASRAAFLYSAPCELMADERDTAPLRSRETARRVMRLCRLAPVSGLAAWAGGAELASRVAGWARRGGCVVELIHLRRGRDGRESVRLRGEDR